jgi:hypothetical protein
MSRGSLSSLLLSAALILGLAPLADAQTLTLEWDPNPEPYVQGYRLYYGTQSRTYSAHVDVGQHTRYELAGLDPTRTWYFTVRAYTEQGVMSDFSNEVSHTAPPAPYVPHPGPELVWQHDTTRQATVWHMTGPTGSELQGWNWLVPGGVNGWRIRAIADFNGDGTPDLIWQNDNTRQATVWYMGGAAGNILLSWNRLTEADLPGWSLVAAADVNRDGQKDLVWQHDSTREIIVWFMGGSQGHIRQRWTRLDATPEPGLRLAAVRDWDADGVPDFVWQQTTGQVLVSYMGGADGTTFRSWKWLTDRAVSGWRVVGNGDFDGDGFLDLVWQHETTREMTVWYMGPAPGHLFRGWNRLTSAPVPGWTALVR